MTRTRSRSTPTAKSRLPKDTRIVRNGAKIRATINNAQFVIDTAKEHGSFTAFLKSWPASDQIGLMEHFKKHASHLGPSATMYFLRFNGWTASSPSPDVNKALIRESRRQRPTSASTRKPCSRPSTYGPNSACPNAT
ncbi:MAG: DNA-3-methyladenine glycosylase I [Hyphomonadaceae bacterium]